MRLVHRIIPQEYLTSFMNQGIRFSPCYSFIDLLEFRLAYCHEKSGLPWPHLEACVRRSFEEQEVNKLIRGTSISCWTERDSESFALWEIYGRSSAAARISVFREALIREVAAVAKFRGVAGSVQYGLGQSDVFLTSMVRPEFLEPFNGLSQIEAEQFHLFFRKHDFYSYEDEFRIVLFDEGPITVPFSPTLVESVTLSPVAPFDPQIHLKLKEVFGERLTDSTLCHQI